MKEIIPDICKDNLSREQIEYLQQQQKEYKFIENIRYIPGLTLFSYNCITGEIKKAEYKNEVSIGLDKNVIIKKKVVIEPNCFYEQALNKKSFEKRIKNKGIVRKEKKYMKLNKF